MLGVAAVIVAVSQFVAPVLPGRLLASRLVPRALSEPGACRLEEARGRVESVERGRIIRVSSFFLGWRGWARRDPSAHVVGDKEGCSATREADGQGAYDAKRGTLRASAFDHRQDAVTVRF